MGCLSAATTLISSRCLVCHYSLPTVIEFFVGSFERISQTVRAQINVIFSSLKLMFERSKSESLSDVSVTTIGDTLFHCFPQTVYGCTIKPYKSLINIYFDLTTVMFRIFISISIAVFVWLVQCTCLNIQTVKTRGLTEGGITMSGTCSYIPFAVIGLWIKIKEGW